MSRASDFAKEYYAKKDEKTANEEAFRAAIEAGDVKPHMSLREMGTVIGIENSQLIRYYLMKFLKEDNPPKVSDGTLYPTLKRLQELEKQGRIKFKQEQL